MAFYRWMVLIKVRKDLLGIAIFLLSTCALKRPLAFGVNFDLDEESVGNKEDKRSITEAEISYIAKTLQPRECLSLMYLLHHSNRKRRRREAADKIKKEIQSVQTTPCKTMLLNYWNNPRYWDQRDFSKVLRTLREIRRQDVATWLVAEDNTSSTDQDSSPDPIKSMVPSAAPNPQESSSYQMPILLYVSLAVCATATALMCLHYLTRRFRHSSQYIALADKDIRSVKYECRCIDKEVRPGCTKKKKNQSSKSGRSCPCK